MTLSLAAGASVLWLVAGVAVGVLSALRPVIDETTRTTLASVVVLDRNGQVVQGLGLGGSQMRLPEVVAALRGETRTVLRRQFC